MLQQKMTYEQVQQKVYKIIGDFCPFVLKEPITDQSNLHSLDLDSLDVAESVLLLEKEFGIIIPDDIAEKCQNVGDFVTLIYDSKAFCKEKGIPMVSLAPKPQDQVAAANVAKNAPNVPHNKLMSSQELMLKQKLQGTDLSELIGKSFELNGYKITISKVSQHTK